MLLWDWWLQKGLWNTEFERTKLCQGPSGGTGSRHSLSLTNTPGSGPVSLCRSQLVFVTVPVFALGVTIYPLWDKRSYCFHQRPCKVPGAACFQTFIRFTAVEQSFCTIWQWDYLLYCRPWPCWSLVWRNVTNRPFISRWCKLCGCNSYLH